MESNVTSQTASVRDKCRDVMRALAEHEFAITEPYLELQRLVLLRDKLVTSHRTTTSGEDDVEEACELVQSAADAVEHRLWSNLSDALSLCTQQPEELVRTAEVLVAQDRVKTRRVFYGGLGLSLEQKDHSQLSDHHNSTEASTHRMFVRAHKKHDWLMKSIVRHRTKSMRQRCFEVIDWSIVQLFEPLLILTRNSVGVVKAEAVEAILEQLSSLLSHVQLASSCVVPCFTEDYKQSLMELYESRYKTWVRVTLQLHCVTALKNTESRASLVSLVRWLTEYLDKMRQHFPSLPTRDFAQDEQFCVKTIGEVMSSFADVSSSKLHQIATNIFVRETKEQPRRDDHGLCVTDTAQDLFSAIDLQINASIKTYGFKGVAIAGLSRLVSDVLQAFQDKQLTFLRNARPSPAACIPEDKKSVVITATTNKTMIFEHADAQCEHGYQYLCAVINTVHKCRRFLDTIREQLLTSSNVDGIESPKLAQAFTEADSLLDVCDERFVTVGVEASSLLVFLSINALNMQLLFNQETSVMEQHVLASLHGFLVDYERCIAHRAFFGQVVKGCLQTLAREYVRAFAASQVKMSASLVPRLCLDYQMLTEFFHDYDDLVPPAIIDNELDLVRLPQHFLGCVDTDFLSVHFPTLRVKFGTKATEVLQGLLALTPNLGGKKERTAVLSQFATRSSSGRHLIVTR